MAQKNLRRRRAPVKMQSASKRRTPTIESVGTELRDVAARLERMESYLVVVGLALQENAGYNNGYIRVLLRSAVGNLLFKQIRALEDLAARCDGGPASDRDHEDDPAEDEDAEGHDE